jgi:hypothetical protein
MIILALYVIFLFAKDNGKINIYGLYLLIVCISSLVINEVLGVINPVLNSWFRLFLFINSFIIVGPLLINESINDFRKCLYKIALNSLLVLNMVSIFSVIAIRDFSFFEGYYGFMESSILLGTTTSFAMIICLARFFQNKNKKSKLFYFVLFFISVPVLLLTAARSAILSLSLALFISFIVNLKKSLPFLFFFGVLAIIFFNQIQVFAGPLLDKMEKRESGDVTAGRGGINYDNFLDFKDNPIIGAGFYNIIHSSNSKINPDGSLEYSSGWLFVLSTTGLLGFIFLLYIFIKTIKRLPGLKYLRDQEFISVVFMIYFFINMNFEGYIYSGGGLLFFILWLSFTSVSMIKLDKKHEAVTG